MARPTARENPPRTTPPDGLRRPLPYGPLRTAIVLLWFGLSSVSAVGCNGCQNTPAPQITATTGTNAITVTGKGFSSIAACAHLSLVGLPPPNASLSIGDVTNCSGGQFTITWKYSYAFCNPSTNVQASVLAFDNSTLASTGQSISFAWGPGCNLSQFCGNPGQAPCNGTQCQTGGIGPDGGCSNLCGAEGQGVCQNGAPCQPGLNPNMQGVLECTANCGQVNEQVCTTPGPPGGVSPVFHCYGPTHIDSSCVCVPDTQSNTCQEINSGNTGQCTNTIFIPPPGQAGCQ